MAITESWIFRINVVIFTLISTAILVRVGSIAAANCELSFVDKNKIYSFPLSSPLPHFPHGVLSEDGFYKVAVNDTVLWFQLCDGLLFNHDPPMCLGCQGCGGSSHCGIGCSALVAENIGGYDVCSTIGQILSTSTHIIDTKNPHKGVIVKMSSSGPKDNCSLSVSVICNSNGVQGPHSVVKTGKCDYSAVLEHPSGCAKIIYVGGKGLHWFGTFIFIVLCVFGGYMLVGSVFRYLFLGVRGIDVIPNMEFWTQLPHRMQSFFSSSVRRFRGPTERHRSSYSSVNF